jgi:hypothetical protein
MFENWKTSAAGLAPLFAGLGSIASMAASGQWDGNALITALGMVGAGVTGLFAKDFTTHSSVRETQQATVDAARQ